MRTPTLEELLKAVDEGERTGQLTPEEARDARENAPATLAEWEMLETYSREGVSASAPTASETPRPAGR